ncbi:MAG: flagellar biosynthetic protein FliQ [Planctomycetota bacterium]|nr:MAG: flagellar biosynthetic protein FliQ [Planctomycetota bacterium]
MMGDGAILDLVREALWLAMLVALPILGSGVLIGLIISIVQSITSVQEQTLTFVPKILVMIGVAVLLSSWIAELLVEFAARMFALW